MLKKTRTLISIVLLPMFSIVCAENASPIALSHVVINGRDKMSLARGAKYFAQNCMVCHTMRYLQHDPIAKKAGITLDKMPLNKKDWWLGIVPPDLTLLARRRTPNWIYTYLHVFYKDESRQLGYNNLLAKDINMPNIFIGIQGEQVLTAKGKVLLAKGETSDEPYYALLELVQAGGLSPEEFDRTMTDLVNFFVYAGDPGKFNREYIGVAVIVFLLLFFVIAYLLKKSYWRDIDN